MSWGMASRLSEQFDELVHVHVRHTSPSRYSTFVGDEVACALEYITLQEPEACENRSGIVAAMYTHAGHVATIKGALQERLKCHVLPNTSYVANRCERCQHM